MWASNVIITLAGHGQFRRLLHDLAPPGEFRRTEFLGVILGRVEDPVTFMEKVQKGRQEQLSVFQGLGRIVPLDRFFHFLQNEFPENTKNALLPYVDYLEGKHSTSAWRDEDPKARSSRPMRSTSSTPSSRKHRFWPGENLPGLTLPGPTPCLLSRRSETGAESEC